MGDKVINEQAATFAETYMMYELIMRGKNACGLSKLLDTVLEIEKSTGVDIRSLEQMFKHGWTMKPPETLTKINETHYTPYTTEEWTNLKKQSWKYDTQYRGEMLVEGFLSGMKDASEAVIAEKHRNNVSLKRQQVELYSKSCKEDK